MLGCCSEGIRATHLGDADPVRENVAPEVVEGTEQQNTGSPGRIRSILPTFVGTGLSSRSTFSVSATEAAN